MNITITEEAGRGSTGVVWRGRDLDANREIAFKVFSSIEPPTVAHLQEHIAAIKDIIHSNVVTVYGIESAQVPGLDDPQLGIVMAFVPGDTLAIAIADRTLTYDEALRVCNGMLDGLEAIHQRGHSHGDLHSKNIRISDGVAMILDPAIRDPTAASTSADSRERQHRDIRTLHSMMVQLLSNVVGGTAELSELALLSDPVITIARLREHLSQLPRAISHSDATETPDSWQLLHQLTDARAWGRVCALLRKCETELEDGIDTWREKYRSQNGTWEDWKTPLQECVRAAEPWLGVFLGLANRPEREYRRLTPDYLAVLDGSRLQGGPVPIMRIRETLAWLATHVIGGQLLLSGHRADALRLAQVEVPEYASSERSTLSKSPDFTGWPEGLGGDSRRAWQFLASLHHEVPTLGRVFRREQDYLSCIGAWNVLLNLIDLARSPQSYRDLLRSGDNTKRLHWEALPMFAMTDAAICRRSLLAVVPTGRSVSSLTAALSFPENDLRELWPKSIQLSLSSFRDMRRIRMLPESAYELPQ